MILNVVVVVTLIETGVLNNNTFPKEKEVIVSLSIRKIQRKGSSKGATKDH